MVSPICNSCSECLCDLGQVSFFGAVKIFAYFSRFFSFKPSYNIHVKGWMYRLVQTVPLPAFTPLSYLTVVSTELLMDLATLHYNAFAKAQK